MRIIDLLNKIANGEEVPKKIKWGDTKYTLYINEDTKQKYYQDDKCRYFFLSIKCLNDLNDTVEILEEEKGIPEKLSTWFSVEITQSDEENVEYANTNFENIYEKINEIIDYLDYLKSKGE